MRRLEDIELTVYSAPEWITYSPFTIEIPEIRLDNLPLIVVYVWLLGSGHWERLPRYTAFTPAYEIGEGELTFIDCQFYFYRVMVIG